MMFKTLASLFDSLGWGLATLLSEALLSLSGYSPRTHVAVRGQGLSVHGVCG